VNKFFIRVLVFITSMSMICPLNASGHKYCHISKSEVATGSGSVISESRELKDFNKIKLNLAGSLEITQGNEESIKIETDDNILPIIETVVKNGTLKIRTIKGKSFNNATKLKISVNLINLNLVGVYSSGSVNSLNLKMD